MSEITDMIQQEVSYGMERALHAYWGAVLPENPLEGIAGLTIERGFLELVGPNGERRAKDVPHQDADV